MYSKMMMYRGEAQEVDVREQLLEQYYMEIFRYCYGILRNRQDAEDATQEVFLKALESPQLAEIDHKSAWLYKIAYRHCINRAKRNKLLQFIPFIESAKEDTTSIEEDFELQTILQQLKVEERALIVLRIVEDKSFDEIAIILSITAATARKRYERLKGKVQKIIKRGAFE
ncbi:RNA polymerase sigma factor [Bacillus ndiopicus]|uniref:RNA polymerase sigma factor n=1 Tax=Bacillus ndiopicus TaxID=1347368 RepID=UPI0005A7AB5A|nr:sigma-70 family RNA polymerase sigma factor [Bacillus ndiopicus]